METLMAHLNNYFYKTGERGEFELIDGRVNVCGRYSVGQYIKIEDSNGVDGVYKVKTIEGNTLTLDEPLNEVFEGVIYGLAVPTSFVELVGRISEFKSKYQDTPYTSESFGGYSYSKAQGRNGKPVSWCDVFDNELRPYKRLYNGKRHIKLINSGSQIEKIQMVQINDNEYIEWN